MASATSKKTELKLAGVAKASLEELRLDYENSCASTNCRFGTATTRAGLL